MAVFWAAGILAITLLPITPYSAPFYGIDELRHALFYGLLSFFMVRGLYLETGMTWRRVLWITLLVAVFGAIDEWHQKLFCTPRQEVSIFDWGEDWLSAFVVAFVMWRQQVGDYSSLAYLRGDLARLAASNVFNNAVTFLTGLMIAAIVSAESFGIYSVAVNVVMTVFSLSELGLGISIVRFYNRHTEETEKNAVLQAGMSIKLVISTLLVIFSFPLGWLLSQILSPNHSIVLELVLAVICASTLGMWSFVRTLYQARQDYKPYAGLTFRYGVIRLFLVAIISSVSTHEVIYYLIALYLAGPLGVTAWAFYDFFKKIGFRLDRQIFDGIKNLFSYGKWVLLGSVLYPLCFSLPLFLLMRLQGAGAAGTYAVGLMFVAMISPFNDAMRAFMLPKVSGFQTHQEALNYIVRITRFIIPFGVALIALMGISAIAFELLLSHKYADGLIIVELLMLASGLTVFGGIMNSISHYLGLPHLDAWVNVGRIVFVTITGALIIPIYGALGAAMSAAVAAVVGELVTFGLLRHRLRGGR